MGHDIIIVNINVNRTTLFDFSSKATYRYFSCMDCRAMIKKIEILNELNEQQPTVSGFQFTIFFRRKFNTYGCDEIQTNTLNIKGAGKFAIATLELFSNKICKYFIRSKQKLCNYSTRHV